MSDKSHYQPAGTETDVLERFLTWAEVDRRRSPNTLRRYRATLAQLEHPVTATQADVEAWWATRTDKSESTRSNELACLRTFYRWCTRFDVRDDDPTRRLDAPRVPNHVPRPVGESDLERVLAAARETSAELYRAVSLGAYAGLRVSETAAPDWSQVDVESRRIFVRGKGRKERVFALSPVLLDKLLPNTGGNVVMAGGTAISGATLQRRVNRFLAANDVEHTFHDLRKRAAMLAIAKTGNVHAVAGAFGWSSIETANHYAVVMDNTLDAIAAAVV